MEKIKYIHRTCPMCNRAAFLKLTGEQIEQYTDYVCYGGIIQDRMPSLDKFGREFVKTGYCPDCQEVLFSCECGKRENFFYFDEVRAESIQNVMQVPAYKNGTLFDKIHVISSSELTLPEKALFLYEFDLMDEYFVDEKGEIVPYEEAEE